jgi:hypothetical protein
VSKIGYVPKTPVKRYVSNLGYVQKTPVKSKLKKISSTIMTF